jgi:hypothetical protein
MAQERRKRQSGTMVSKTKESATQAKKQANKRTKPDTIKKEQERTTASKQRMIDAMQTSLGVVTTACQVAEVSRSQHYDWMQTDPEYANKIKEVTEMCHDFVESSLFKQIKDGSTTATIFYMKCRMRERGYIEKMDVDLNTNRPDMSGLTTDEIREHLAKKRDAEK